MIVAVGPALLLVARHFAVTVKNPLSPRLDRETLRSAREIIMPSHYLDEN